MFSFKSAIAAAGSGTEAFAKEFEKENADPNVEDALNSRIPLVFELIALIEDHKLPALIAILIRLKLDLKKEWGEGRNALSQAAIAGKKATINYLVQQGMSIQGNAVIYWAACNTKPAIARETIYFLLDTYGVDINASAGGSTALIRAASTSALEVINSLLSKGASLYASNDGLTPLMQAYIQNKKFADGKRLTNECFYALVDATIQQLSLKVARFTGTDEGLTAILNREIEALAGNYSDFRIRPRYSSFASSIAYEKSGDSNLNSVALCAELRKKIVPKVIQRTQDERNECKQRLAFCLGDMMPLSSEEEKNIPGNRAYFQSEIYDSNVSKILFSFFQKSIAINDTAKAKDGHTVTLKEPMR